MQVDPDRWITLRLLMPHFLFLMDLFAWVWLCMSRLSLLMVLCVKCDSGPCSCSCLLWRHVRWVCAFPADSWSGEGENSYTFGIPRSIIFPSGFFMVWGSLVPCLCICFTIICGLAGYLLMNGGQWSRCTEQTSCWLPAGSIVEDALLARHVKLVLGSLRHVRCSIMYEWVDSVWMFDCVSVENMPNDIL